MAFWECQQDLSNVRIPMSPGQNSIVFTALCSFWNLGLFLASPAFMSWYALQSLAQYIHSLEFSQGQKETSVQIPGSTSWGLPSFCVPSIVISSHLSNLISILSICSNSHRWFAKCPHVEYRALVLCSPTPVIAGMHRILSNAKKQLHCVFYSI